MLTNNKFSESDLLYAMIESLDYESLQYGNDSAWYAQGVYNNIKVKTAQGDIITPHGSSDYNRFESNKPNGDWKNYI